MFKRALGTSRRLFARFDLRDLFVAAGLGCAFYGAQQLYPAGAWVGLGAALFWLGIRR